jgi:hypothetical protein
MEGEVSRAAVSIPIAILTSVIDIMAIRAIKIIIPVFLN